MPSIAELLQLFRFLSPQPETPSWVFPTAYPYAPTITTDRTPDIPSYPASPYTLPEGIQRAYAKIGEIESVAHKFPDDMAVLSNLSSLKRDAEKLWKDALPNTSVYKE